MNFQNLPTVQPADHYLDVSFGKAKHRVLSVRKPVRLKSEKIVQLRQTEALRLGIIVDYIESAFTKVITDYPNVSRMSPFYQDLMKNLIDVGEFRKSLGALQWCISQCRMIRQSYTRKVYGARNTNLLHRLRKEYYGRISSYLKQINPQLKYLEWCRRVMKGFPDIKVDMKSVAIVGFPNVGKTTLLMKITGSKAKISNYAFTTTGINISYAHDIQWIDTPGALNRVKQNPIEVQADLILKHVAHEIVCVIDASESSYPLEQQLKLLSKLQALKKPLKVYFSKEDLNPARTEAVRKMIRCDELRI